MAQQPPTTCTYLTRYISMFICMANGLNVWAWRLYIELRSSAAMADALSGCTSYSREGVFSVVKKHLPCKGFICFLLSIFRLKINSWEIPLKYFYLKCNSTWILNALIIIIIAYQCIEHKNAINKIDYYQYQYYSVQYSVFFSKKWFNGKKFTWFIIEFKFYLNKVIHVSENMLFCFFIVFSSFCFTNCSITIKKNCQ